MRCQVFLLAVLVVCSLCLAGYIHHKRNEELKLAKHASFQNVKHRVTRDVLKEYMTHVVESSSLLDKTKKQVEDLKSEVAKAQEVTDAKRVEVNTCNGELKSMTDQVAAVETEKTNTEGEFNKKKASLQEQTDTLKKEVAQRSKVCDFIKKDSEGRKLCGIEVANDTAKEEKTDEKKSA